MPTYVDTSFGDKFVFDGSIKASDKCCGGLINLKLTIILPGGTFRAFNLQVPHRPESVQLAKRTPVQLIRTKCIHRSENPIEFGHNCCGGQGDVYDCEVFEKCVIARSSQTDPTFPACSDCKKYVAEQAG